MSKNYEGIRGRESSQMLAMEESKGRKKKCKRERLEKGKQISAC
jgi:hypothetical protein